MLVVAFPTRFEAQDFFRAIEKAQKFKIEGVEGVTGLIGTAEVAGAIVGIGAIPAARNTETLFRHFSIDIFVLAGFAGALIPELERGHILVAQGYSSEALMNDLKMLTGFDVARLYTSNAVIGRVAEKMQLAASTGCQFVDMETAGAAAVAEKHEAELIGVRAISDLADEDVPTEVFARSYDYELSMETPWRLFLYLLLHPHKIFRLMKFLSPLPEVRRKLTRFLVELAQNL